MGVDLFGKGKNLMLSHSWWRIVRSIAREYGWIPMGTLAPDPSLWTEEITQQSPEPDKTWCGCYYSSDWQEVCEDDAKNMVNALGLGIIDLAKGQRDQELIETFWADELKDGRSVPPAEEFRQNVISLCEEFIDFCKGPFLIG